MSDLRISGVHFSPGGAGRVAAGQNDTPAATDRVDLLQAQDDFLMRLRALEDQRAAARLSEQRRENQQVFLTRLPLDNPYEDYIIRLGH